MKMFNLFFYNSNLIHFQLKTNFFTLFTISYTLYCFLFYFIYILFLNIKIYRDCTKRIKKLFLNKLNKFNTLITKKLLFMYNI
jgi:hypothetical protein